MLVHLQVLAVLCHRAHQQGLGPGEQEPGGEAQARVHRGQWGAGCPTQTKHLKGQFDHFVCLKSFIIIKRKSNIAKIIPPSKLEEMKILLSWKL